MITGGTSGIGKATAEAMRRRGYTVYELSRRETGLAGFCHIPTDVTKPEMVEAAVAEILRQETHIDVLINNAGFGVSGAVEFTEAAAAKKQFEVNFFGMVNMCHAVLPVMRAAGRGRIVNLSSVAGVVPIPFQTYYSASKAAINSYTMALANEVKPLRAGALRRHARRHPHRLYRRTRKKSGGDEVYQGRISRSVAGMEHDEQTGMLPETAGDYIGLRRHPQGRQAASLDRPEVQILLRPCKAAACPHAQLARRPDLRKIKKDTTEGSPGWDCPEYFCVMVRLIPPACPE